MEGDTLFSFNPRIEESRGVLYREVCGVPYTIPLICGLLSFSLVGGNCRWYIHTLLVSTRFDQVM